MSTHVTPIDDLYTHHEESTCYCQPRFELFNGEMCFIHNAYDKREYLERALAAEDTTESMGHYSEYIKGICILGGEGVVEWKWVKDKIAAAFAKLYKYWKEKGVEITFDT